MATGLPFFDHMISQLGRHSGFDLELRAQGDLAVDAHHTVEDVGIVLGEALHEALGDKAGVRRFASMSVPLDEALIEVALDLSGRPFLLYDVDPGAGRGGLPAGRPAFRPAISRRVLAGFLHFGRHNPAHHDAPRAQHPPHPGGVVQVRGPGFARRRAGRGRGRALYERGAGLRWAPSSPSSITA